MPRAREDENKDGPLVYHRRISRFINSEGMDIKSILVPTDFSECAGHALAPAASLARMMIARLIGLHVIEPAMPTVGFTPVVEPLPVADISERLEDSATRELPKFARHEECIGLDVED